MFQIGLATSGCLWLFRHLLKYPFPTLTDTNLSFWREATEVNPLSLQLFEPENHCWRDQRLTTLTIPLYWWKLHAVAPPPNLAIHSMLSAPGGLLSVPYWGFYSVIPLFRGLYSCRPVAVCLLSMLCLYCIRVDPHKTTIVHVLDMVNSNKLHYIGSSCQRLQCGSANDLYRFLFVQLSIFLPIYLTIFPHVYFLTYPSNYFSIDLAVYLV